MTGPEEEQEQEQEQEGNPGGNDPQEGDYGENNQGGEGDAE
jgi:hypothetical protein